jgi:hypothetical protein
LCITDPVEALVVEHALALARQLQQVCRETPPTAKFWSKPNRWLSSGAAG